MFHTVFLGIFLFVSCQSFTQETAGLDESCSPITKVDSTSRCERVVEGIIPYSFRSYQTDGQWWKVDLIQRYFVYGVRVFQKALQESQNQEPVVLLSDRQFPVEPCLTCSAQWTRLLKLSHYLRNLCSVHEYGLVINSQFYLAAWHIALYNITLNSRMHERLEVIAIKAKEMHLTNASTQMMNSKCQMMSWQLLQQVEESKSSFKVPKETSAAKAAKKKNEAIIIRVRRSGSAIDPADCTAPSEPRTIMNHKPTTTLNSGRERWKITVTWGEPVDSGCNKITHYQIRYPTSTSNPVNSTTTSYTLYADGDQNIAFSVAAVNDAANSSSWNFIPVLTGELRPQLAPTEVSIQADSSSCVTLSWEPPQWPNAPVIGYEYKPNTENGTQWTPIGDVRSQQICQYSPYEKVQCQIRATNSKGSSDVATTGEIRTRCAAPSEPRGISFGQPSSAKQSGRLRLKYTVTWQEPSDKNCEIISKYNTRYPAADSTVSHTTARSRDVYADGYSPVEFHVTAINNDGLESAAAFFSFTTPEIRPQLAPTSVSSRTDSSSCVTISWQPPQWPNGLITSYKVITLKR